MGGDSTHGDLPKLPSKVCRFSESLMARAYTAAGQPASALHAMATYQRYQAEKLAKMQEGGSPPGLQHELRMATDYALKTTKLAVSALGKTMSTLVVQKCHLWLSLADMSNVDKARFLNAPISQAGLFGDTVGEFTQEFSTVKEQSKAMGKDIDQRARKTASPAAPSAATAPRRRHPPAAPTSAPLPLPAPPAKRQHQASRGTVTPLPQGAVKSGKRTAKRSWDGLFGEEGNCSFLGGGPRIITSVLNDSKLIAAGLRANGNQISKRAVSSLSRCANPSTASLGCSAFQLAAPGPLASGPQSAAERTPFSHSGLTAASREEGKRNSLIFSSFSGRSASRDEHSYPKLPLCWHVSDRSDGAISARSAGLVSAAQRVAVAHTDGQTRLCDSVCYSPSQVHGCPFHEGGP
ncbi:uncharacterized protein [Danio rerio]|uniref:Uncharacterized protein n=1 Tax=Danio rerio TaxID=7955 RepID=A0AC58HJ64_DANRE